MRRKALSAVLVVALWLGAASPGMAASFLLFEEYGGTWQDVNKSPVNPDDDLMCWAAAAANVLAWGNWGTTAFNTADKIFQHILDHWTNNLGWARNAWRWWFNGYSPPISSYAYVNVPGGGNFYPDLNINDYHYNIYENTLVSVIGALDQGYGVALTIYPFGGSTGHVVTCWGYSYDLVSGQKLYTGLYLTDSDDNLLGLVYYPLVWANNLWQLGGRYQGWYLSTASVLRYNPTAVATPVPSSLLLVASGLMGMGLVWRRRRDRR